MINNIYPHLSTSKHIYPPTVTEILNIDSQTQQKMDQIKLSESIEITEKASRFKGFAVKIANVTDIKMAYRKVKQLALNLITSF